MVQYPTPMEMEYFFGGGSDMCYLCEEADDYIRAVKRLIWLSRLKRAWDVMNLLHDKVEHMKPYVPAKTLEYWNDKCNRWLWVFKKCQAYLTKLPPHSDWMSITYSMPAVGVPVLVYGYIPLPNAEKASFKKVAKLNKNDPQYHNWEFSCNGVVTHWMPLPASPKEKND